MKKVINVFLAVVITLFSIPLNGLNVSAEGVKYENGTYDLPTEILQKDNNELSKMNQDIDSNAKLIVEEDNLTVLLTIIDSSAWSYFKVKYKNEFIDTKVVDEKGNTKVVEFIIDDPNEIVDAIVGVEVLGNSADYDVRLKFDPSNLKLKTGSEDDNENNNDSDPGSESEVDEVIDNEKSENEDDSANNGNDKENGQDEIVKSDDNLIKEEEAVKVYELNYISTLDISKNFKNPVKVLETENGKRYVQMSGSSGNLIISLKINGKEVTWGEVKEDGTFTIQFEVDGPLSKELDFYMEYYAGPLGKMNHTTSLSFGKEYDLNEPIRVTGDEKIIVNDVQITPPSNLPSDVELIVTDKKDDVKNQGDLILAGGVYDFDFKNLGDNPGEFQITMTYDNGKYPDSEYDIAIYYYDEDSKTWIKQDSEVFRNTVTATVDHFSIYGVFAVEKSDIEEPLDKPQEDPIDISNLTEGVYKIDYEFSSSHMKSFTDGVAYVKVDKNGTMTVAMTFNSADAIEYIKINGNKVKILKYTDDNKVIFEFRTEDLTKKHSADIKVNYMGYESEYEKMEFWFKADTIVKVDDSLYPVGIGEKPKKEEKVDQAKSKGEKGTTIKPDKVKKFNYVIYKADANEPSAADQFFVKPGYLLEKNGKQYIQLYINGWNFMNWLKLKETNKHVDVVKVEGNRALIQFEYNGDLSEEIWLVMNLTVPGVYDKETYEARMVIDQASIEEIDPEGHYIHLAKPDFGDAEKDEKAGAKNTTNNPKTGDTSQVLFYTVLLIASLIALVYQVRKQLATSA